ncbi:MAG: 4'-phosphopantetheinyl transferase [Deltaproteobacteria bacterium]|nr:MAG: 4'-phosphopantetheinyl transferase [Deltaproteobacteria bacterium]
MICGVGLDIVTVERIERIVETRKERFLYRVYTDRECASSLEGGHAAKSLSGRFAAKEAAMKALGTGWGDGVRWRDFEVVTGSGGKPELFLHGKALSIAEARGITASHVSISHDAGIASAVVIMEKV